MAQVEAVSPGHPDSAAPSVATMPDSHGKARFWTLALGAIGVVYGDIGTSPLYALKESLTAAAAGGALTREMVFGIVSLEQTNAEVSFGAHISSLLRVSFACASASAKLPRPVFRP